MAQNFDLKVIVLNKSVIVAMFFMILLSYITIGVNYPRSTLVREQYKKQLTIDPLCDYNVIFFLVDGLSDRMIKPSNRNLLYENRLLGVYNRIVREQEQNRAFYSKVKVSPPTWTVDRLNSLLTGGFGSENIYDMLAGLEGIDNIFSAEDIYFNVDIVWQKILNKDTSERIKYYNYYVMNEGEVNDEIVVNDVLKVRFLLIPTSS